MGIVPRRIGVSPVIAALTLFVIVVIGVAGVGLILSNAFSQLKLPWAIPPGVSGGQVITSPNGWETAPQSGLSLLEAYFTSKYNPAIGLVAVSTSEAYQGGVTFNFENGSVAPVVPPFQRYLPLENWATAASFEGLGFDTQMAQSIFGAVNNLTFSIGWHAPWNRESMMGFIIPYDKTNANLAFVKANGAYLTMPNGTSYQIDQAAPWNFSNQSWVGPDPNPNDAKGLDPNAIDETLFQALNFYLRGDLTDAMANLQGVANIAVKNPDGSVGFGFPPFRGMYLGTFLEAAEVIGVPKLPNGISMDDIANTIWTLQSGQSDGGIPRQYSSFTAGVLGSDDETTNAALLAYSPGVIEYVSAVRLSGAYNLTSIPSSFPVVGI